MGLGSSSADLLFKIKADGSQAESELRKMIGGVLGLGEGFEKMAGPAGIAAGAVLAVGAAAVTGAAALFEFTKQAAEYGSALYDASIKTGLGADAISALKLAADSSGSSLEAISGSVAKFNVMLGQAAQGNEKAQAVLKQYGITSKDTTIALDQAVRVIGQMSTADQKAAASKDLFKDKTGAIIPVVDQLNGRFIAFIANAKKLGATLSEEDLRASDEFGDSLEVLGNQAKVAGVKFASELMPMCIRAMNAISNALSNNQGVARQWGNIISQVCQGVAFVFTQSGNAISNILRIVSLGLINNQSAWQSWSMVAKVAIASVMGAAGALLGLLRMIGEKTAPPPGAENSPLWKSAHSTIPGGYQSPQIKIPSTGGGGGGGKGGGGGGGEDVAERNRKKAIDEAEKEMRRKLEIYRQTADEQEEIENGRLARNEINEFEHMQRIHDLKIREAQFEANLLIQLGRNPQLNKDEKADIDHQTRIANVKVRVEELKKTNEITKANRDANEEAAAAIRKALDDAFEILEKEKERLRVIRQQRQEREHEYNLELKRRREARDPYNLGGIKKTSDPTDADWDVSKSGDLLTGIVDSLGAAKEQLPAMQQVGAMLVQTFGQVAQAVGQAVKSFILFGTAGGSFKKFAVEVIASLAQMAVVQAIFEAAQGLAMLALSWFTGNPKYAKSASGHFAAAATFGMIGGVATAAGRLAAGNSFNQASGGGGGNAGGGDGAGDNQPLNFTSGGFSGFSQRQQQENSRLREVVGYLAEQVEMFANKFGPVTPGQVVMAGAGDAAPQIASAMNDHFDSDLRASTNTKRSMGDYD